VKPLLKNFLTFRNFPLIVRKFSSGPFIKVKITYDMPRQAQEGGGDKDPSNSQASSKEEAAA
jgi:hypothetical protein